MWQAFVLMHKTFKSGAELYLEGQSLAIPIGWIFAKLTILFIDMLPALDNFVTFGSLTLTQNPAYLQALVGMVEDIFHDEKVGGVDRICGCKLAEALMLNLRGHMDQYIPTFISLAMTVLSSDETHAKSYRIHLMEMVINSIYYNPLLSLQVLESKEWTNKFFSTWFSNMDMFNRVHDKKLCIVAISSLLTLRANDVPTSVQPGWPRLLQGVSKLFQTLPAALKRMFTIPLLSSFIRRLCTDQFQIAKKLLVMSILAIMKEMMMMMMTTRPTIGVAKWSGQRKMKMKAPMEILTTRVNLMLSS